MSGWISTLSVGEGGPFGKSECKLSYFHGRVAQVHLNKMPISNVSGGAEYKYGKLYVSPITTETTINTEFKMWVRSDDNKDFSWESTDPLNVSNGQRLTLLFLNSKFVAYVNHNTDSWQYVRSDNKIADIAGQRGMLLENGEEIDNHGKGSKKGIGIGFFAGLLAYFMTLFVGDVDFWGWDWVEKPSSSLWYLVPLGVFSLGAMAHRNVDYYSMVIVALIMAAIGWFFDIHTWMMVIMSLGAWALVVEPSKKYGRYINPGALETVKEGIYQNANYALRSFGHGR